MKLRKLRGFSLIELLVAITIIAILFAITIPNYLLYKQRFLLQQNTEKLFTYLQESFTESRFLGKSLYFSINADNNTVKVFSCRDKYCTQKDESPRKQVTLDPNIQISENVELIFTAPFGDISFPKTPNTQSTLSFTLSNDTQAFTFTIYKHSGLIDVSSTNSS